MQGRLSLWQHMLAGSRLGADVWQVNATNRTVQHVCDVSCSCVSWQQRGMNRAVQLVNTRWARGAALRTGCADCRHMSYMCSSCQTIGMTTLVQLFSH
jgi:hypothetical protein